MAPAVLLINERWGSPLDGGPAAATRMIVRILHAMGLSVYCTFLESTREIEKEAATMGVDRIVTPDPKGRLRFRRPHPDWVFAYEVYYPDVSELKDVKIILGFGLNTSDAALRIWKNEFQSAGYFLVNCWSMADSTPKTLGYNWEEFFQRCKWLVQESKEADAIFSVGPKAYDYFQPRYQNLHNVSHFQLMPMPECKILTQGREEVKDGDEIKILSYLQCGDMREIEGHIALAQSVNQAVSTIYDGNAVLPKWHIIGVASEMEDKVIEALEPHATAITIIPRPMLENFETELRSSDLVLIPPISAYSLQFALNSMAAGVPVIIPRDSDSHALVADKFADFQSDVCVDIEENADAMAEKIMYVLLNLTESKAKALKLAEAIQEASKSDMPKVNEDFVKRVLTTFIVDMPYQMEWVSSLSSAAASNELAQRMDQKWKQSRNPFEIRVRIRTKGGVSERGKTMVEVDDALYGKQREEFEEALKRLLGVHKGLRCKSADWNELTFVLDCQEMAALKELWMQYQTGRLNKKMEETIVTRKLREEVNVIHLALDTVISIEEYELCKHELQIRGDAAEVVEIEDPAAEEKMEDEDL
ncbi:uncharacterized protein [Ptychodera flava]|uniref:uncharacterized protein isoform X2 n=1 Tax=Ptychodera flava TaxID=63121 RepID=UPI00396A1A13